MHVDQARDPLREKLLSALAVFGAQRQGWDHRIQDLLALLLPTVLLLDRSVEQSGGFRLRLLRLLLLKHV